MKQLLLALVVAAATACGAADIVPPNSPHDGVAEVQVALDRTFRVKVDCQDDSMDSGGSAVDLGDGQVVTAKHVLDPFDPDTCVIDLYKGAHAQPAYFVAYHDKVDLALLRFERRTEILPFVELPLGGELIVVGYPSGDIGVTTGVVAGEEDKDGMVRITAGVWFGNSGGGVWSRDGKLTGVAVAFWPGRPDWSYMVPVKYVEEMLL